MHAVSPGPIRTRAASGIDRFDELLDRAAAGARERELVDVGALAAILVSDAARRITGTIIPVDSGQHLFAWQPGRGSVETPTRRAPSLRHAGQIQVAIQPKLC